ncbi:MAG: hypothetical protein M3Z01_01530 [Thermoproteota archaeon]|nr:hypothetical protein [Thermoproteota archaeon]
MKDRENNLNRLVANGSTPEYVAKVVLEAITNDKPKLRYLAGKDVEQWVDAKKKMSDEEFINMMKQR